MWRSIELNGCIQSFVWTTKPVHTLEDLKGRKIRSPGGLVPPEWIEKKKWLVTRQRVSKSQRILCLAN